MKRALKYKALLVTTVLVLAVSCGKDSVEYPTPVQKTEIMTYLGETATGIALEIQPTSDVEPVTAYANVRFASHVSRGQRLLVRYAVEFPDINLRPLPITILSAGTIVTCEIEPKSLEEIGAMNPGQVRITSLWQTPGFVNMQVMEAYDGHARGYALVADEATLNADVVDCYIVNPGDMVSPDVERRSIASFSTKAIGDKKIRICTYRQK